MNNRTHSVIQMTEADHMAKLDDVIAAYMALLPYEAPQYTTEAEHLAFRDGLALGYQAATRGLVHYGHLKFEREDCNG